MGFTTVHGLLIFYVTYVSLTFVVPVAAVVDDVGCVAIHELLSA